MLVGVLGWKETLPWARRCNKLHSTICIVLLSEFVSQNAWLQHLLFPIVTVSIYIPTSCAGGSLSSTSSPACIGCRLFDDGHSDLYEVIPHCSFDLHFSNKEWCWSSFHVFIGHLYVLYLDMSCIWKNVCLGLLPIFLSELFVFLIVSSLFSSL